MKPLSKDRIAKIAKYGNPSKQEARLLASMTKKLMRPKIEPTPIQHGEKLFRIELMEVDGGQLDRVFRIDCTEVIGKVLHEDEKSLRRVSASVSRDLLHYSHDGDQVISRTVLDMGKKMGVDIVSRLPMEKGGWRKPPRVYPVMRPFTLADAMGGVQ